MTHTANNAELKTVRFLRDALALLACLLVLATPAGPAAAQEQQTAQVQDAIGGFLQRVRQLSAHKAEPGDLACRSERDAVADRVFRLHTQLMVASLACGDQYGDAEAYSRYRLFTQEHADLLRRSQTTLEGGFSGNGERAFDDYRTRLANSESSLIIASSTPSYCRMRRARFESLLLTNPAVFPDYARELAVRDRIYKAC